MELPAWLSALASLTSLELEVDSLPAGDDNAERLAGLAQLRNLTVHVLDQVDDALPAGLHGLPHLTALELRVQGAMGLPGNPAARSLSRLSALHTLKWLTANPWVEAPALPAGILELRSLRSLQLNSVTPESLRPGPCWAGLTHLSCYFSPNMHTLPSVLALATAMEHLELSGLAGLDAAALATLERMPALRRLGLPLHGLKPCAEGLHALGQARPHLSLYDPRPPWR